jgi:hypothetical protein
MSTAGLGVRFDFEGSLELARRLWQLADHLDQFASTRLALAQAALADWLGPFGTQFGDRVDTELSDASTGSNLMRAVAESWAQSWAKAMNQQNRVFFAREVCRIQDSRSNFESVVGGIFGHDDLPAEPSPVSPPTAPSFYPTGSFVRYSQ